MNEKNEILEMLDEAYNKINDSYTIHDPEFEGKPITRESVINKKSRIPKEIREEYADELVAYHKWARRSRR